MKHPSPLYPRRLAAVAVGALAAAGLSLGVTAATAGTPTHSPSDPNLVGEITLYDAAGQPVDHGSLADGPIAAYAVGSVVPAAGAATATLYAYTPTASGNDVALPQLWTGLQLTTNQAAPASLPAGVPAGKPVVTLDAGATTLGQYVAGNPSTVTAPGLADVYELRLRTDGPGSATVQYDAVDLLVNGDTWSVVGTDLATPTTTTLAVSPGSGAKPGDPLTLTASVSPGAAAGSVEFFDGTTSLGTAAVASGSAGTTVTATAGSHAFKAVFTPTDATVYGGSTSSVTSYTVAANPVATTTKLAATPSSVKAGANLTLAATVTPSAAGGTVQFYDGTKTIGSAKAVSGGKASLATKVTTAGSHTFHAVFTPTSATAYQQSGHTLVVSIGKAASKVAISVPAKVKTSAKAKLTATVRVTGLTPAGSVTVYDGKKKLGTAVVKNGKATFTLPKLTKGAHTIKVTYAGTANIASSSATTKVTAS